MCRWQSLTGWREMRSPGGRTGARGTWIHGSTWTDMAGADPRGARGAVQPATLGAELRRLPGPARHLHGGGHQEAEARGRHRLRAGPAAQGRHLSGRRQRSAPRAYLLSRRLLARPGQGELRLHRQRARAAGHHDGSRQLHALPGGDARRHGRLCHRLPRMDGAPHRRVWRRREPHHVVGPFRGRASDGRVPRRGRAPTWARGQSRQGRCVDQWHLRSRACHAGRRQKSFKI